MSSGKGVGKKGKEPAKGGKGSVGLTTKDPENGAVENDSSVVDHDSSEGLVVGVEAALLDCPICFEPLQQNGLFQCKSGHMLCFHCFVKLLHKCPTCGLSVAKIRCMVLESIIESNKISCMYARYGCKKPVAYNRKDVHEKYCSYAPCCCPVPACAFTGQERLLSPHLRSHHSSVPQLSFYYEETFEVSLDKEQSLYILRERMEGDSLIFVLITRRVASGFALAVICICSYNLSGVALKRSSRSRRYKLSVSDADKLAKLNFEGYVECMREWRDEHPPKYFLCVPDESLLEGNVEVQIDDRRPLSQLLSGGEC